MTTTPWYSTEDTRLYVGDCGAILRALPDASVQCAITSPPYYNLRDYYADGQLGNEATPEAYVEHLVLVFRELRRVLRDNGVFWLVIGDCYAGAGYSNHRGTGGAQRTDGGKQRHALGTGYHPKSLLGIPWRVAFALQDDGWLLRSDIIWQKPNPQPGSQRDRPTSSHEYVFLLAKSGRYYYDNDAIKEPAVSVGDPRNRPDYVPRRHTFVGGEQGVIGGSARTRVVGYTPMQNNKRTKRDVWTIPPRPLRGVTGRHFAAFPEKLVEPCVLAGSAPGDTVLDPFMGSGTTLVVARRYGRNSIGIDINEDYATIAMQRLDGTQHRLAA